MILRIKFSEPLRETNSQIDFEEFYPAFAKLTDNHQKTILLFYDLGSPLKNLSEPKKIKKIADILRVDNHDIEAWVSYNDNKNPIDEIRSYQEDPMEAFYDSMRHQIFSISNQLKTIKVNIVDKSYEKVFHRIVDLFVRGKTIQESMSAIEKELLTEDEKNLRSNVTGYRDSEENMSIQQKRNKR